MPDPIGQTQGHGQVDDWQGIDWKAHECAARRLSGTETRKEVRTAQGLPTIFARRGRMGSLSALRIWGRYACAQMAMGGDDEYDTHACIDHVIRDVAHRATCLRDET